jgi:hypothetical protein
LHTKHFTEKAEEKTPIERSRSRGEDDIKIDLEEVW